MKSVIGGEVVAAMLAAEGVDTVFGIIDGTYMGLYASFEKYGIRLITPRHETSAAHMAGAYARLSGKLGVCIASNGPGVANILPGVAVESGEGNRVLLITSCRRQGIAYPDRGGSYQYFDQVGVTKAMTKWSGSAPTFERIPELMRRAFRISHRGRPGVVHVDIPENIFNGAYEIEDDYLRQPEAYRRTERIGAPRTQVERAAAMLRDARLPLVHAGTGVVHSGAFEELSELAAMLHSPVTTSWGAGSAMPCGHPLRIPTPALAASKEARNRADVVLVLGSRLGETDWWGKAPYWARDQRVIQVDIDEEVLGLNKPAELAVLADAKSFLRELVDALRATPSTEATLASRRAEVAELAAIRDSSRAELLAALENKADPMHSAHVPYICREFFDDDAVLVIDGGNAAVWTSFYHQSRVPNTVLSTFKLGMLGAGVSQALGAKVAMPGRQVYCILGDGAMGFHPQEIETAVRNELPVIFIVLCDKQWGMVKLTQTFGLGPLREVLGVDGNGPINSDFSEIKFDDMARSMGAHGERVSAPSELRPALERCVASGRAAVVHVDVDPMLHLMAPGLLEFKAMHAEPEG
jgi:acetolactate synthase-1/2/3 large subunit